MNINDFIIKKKTKYVFQILRFVEDGKTIEYSKLGDSIKEYMKVSEVEKYFSLVPFLSPEGKKIISIRKELTSKQLEQFLVYNDYKEEFEPTSSFDLDDDIYDELKSHLNSLNKNPDVSSINSKLKDKIKAFKTQDEKKVVKLDEDDYNYDRKEGFFSRESIDYSARQKKEDESEDFKFNVIEPNESDSMDNIVMAKVTKEKIEASLVKYDYGNFFDDYLSNDTVKSNEGALVLNLYGPPGTGKTISAKAFAHKLKKKILIVDFAQLISKMVGDTGKNIQKYFDKAKKDDLILFFDEADTLIQKRSTSGESNSHHSNQNQNIFMRELDNFNGIVILTTNLFENYDEALLRRITNIPYPLPTEEMRIAIIKHHLPEKVKCEKSVTPENLAKETDGFSGGDIKNFIKDAIIKSANIVIQENKSCTKDEIKELIVKNIVSMKCFLEEIDYVYKNKKDYKKDQEFSRKKIGLAA